MSALLAFIFGPGGVYTVLAALIGAALLYARKTGKDVVRAEQAKDRLDAIKDKKEIDDEIAGLGHADLDPRFERWLRDKR